MRTTLKAFKIAESPARDPIRDAPINWQDRVGMLLHTGMLVLVVLPVSWRFPQEFWLMVLSILLLALGFASAAIAWTAGLPREVPRWTLWDQAGLLTFVGFAAALASDSAEVLSCLEQIQSGATGEC